MVLPGFCFDVVVHVAQVLQISGRVRFDRVAPVTQKLDHLRQVGIPPPLICKIKPPQ